MTTQTLFADQGADFSKSLTLQNDDGTPINVASYVFRGVVRKNYYSTLPSANLVITTPDPANGVLLIAVAGSTSANLEQGRYIYTVQANNGSGITPVLDGDFILNPSVLNDQPTPQTVVFPQTLPNTSYYDTANSNQFA